MIEAMKLVLAGVTPYTAAKRVGVNITTMYRSKLYKLWLANDIVALKQMMNVYRPIAKSKKSTKKRSEENLDR